MSRKAFHISVDFDVHAVTCPGVWLCPKGVVMLRVAMFGLSENTKTIRPCFPLLFHERFRFRKLLKSVNSLSCLQEVLKCRNLHIQLVHLANGPSCCPATILATFKSPLVDVFYPTPNDRGLNVGVDVDLLLNPTSAFPGIISPKAEISTRLVIEEVINYPSPNEDSWIVNPVTVTSKKSDINRPDDVNRQRPVCHSEGAGDMNITDSHICCCYNNSNKKSHGDAKPDVDKPQRPPFVTGKFRTCGKPGSMDDKLSKFRRCRPKKQIGLKNQDQFADETCKEKSLQKPVYPQPCKCFTVKKKSGSICDCILCKKYNDYFQDNNDANSSDNDSSCGLNDGNDKAKKCDVKQNKNKAAFQTKKPSPLKINEKKRRFPLDSKEPFKPRLPEPMIKQIPTQRSPHTNFQGGDCPIGDCCSEICHNFPECESDHPRIPPTVCNQTCQRSVRNGAEIGKQKENIYKCGIYSCSERQPSKVCSPPVFNHNPNSSPTKFMMSQKKTHRQIFYSSLEDYYRKLYDRARERSAIEEVQAFA